MVAAGFGDHGTRMRAALLAGSIEVAVIIALINGFAAGGGVRPPAGLSSIFTAEPRPRPTPPPPRHVANADSGSTAPAGKRDQAAPVIAAPSPLPSAPIPAATQTGAGFAANTGAANQGSGSGAGGLGSGSGSGSGGPGDSDGGEDAELVGGRITDRDYPDSAKDARASGRTETEIFVDARGRATDCQVRRSSGNAALDFTTCRLALERFRFRPARDLAGRPIAGSIYYDQTWQIGRIDDDPGP